MIWTYKLVEADVKYILLPKGASLEDALRILGIDRTKIIITLEAIG